MIDLQTLPRVVSAESRKWQNSMTFARRLGEKAQETRGRVSGNAAKVWTFAAKNAFSLNMQKGKTQQNSSSKTPARAESSPTPKSANPKRSVVTQRKTMPRADPIDFVSNCFRSLAVRAIATESLDSPSG